MLDLVIPDLTFPDLSYSKSTVPLDLRCLLYRGGAGTNVKLVGGKIDAGDLGRPVTERVELVRRIHEVFLNQLGSGGSRNTTESTIWSLKIFFRWGDAAGASLAIDTVERCYLDWTDALLRQSRTSEGIAEKTAYQYGSMVGWLLDRVLERKTPILKKSRLRKPKHGVRAVSQVAEKQNLEATFAFGHFLLDLAAGLSVDAIFGPLPVRIPLRNGRELEEWARLKRPEFLNPQKNARQSRYHAMQGALKLANWEAERTLRTRFPLVNLRILAEMLMLAGQPGVNLAQLHQLRMDQWRFKSSTHGYEIRTYKNRRFGEVVFEIYSEYRRVFERYLEWRKAIFPDDPDGLLFPLIRRGRLIETPPKFHLLKERCERAGIQYFSPQSLRNTSVNWMLRRSSDPDLTAEEKQHSTKTLIAVYEKPSLQRAMVQITGFWAKHDPMQAAAGPGSCIGKGPVPITDIPPTATKPDCVTPAGCLFCANQRDIDSQDHVWSLATYRRLKTFELSAYRQPESKKNLPEHPAELAIDRVTAKLHFIRNTNAKRHKWVSEALLRIEEGRYHPDWARLIEDLQTEMGNDQD